MNDLDVRMQVEAARAALDRLVAHIADLQERVEYNRNIMESYRAERDDLLAMVDGLDERPQPVMK